MSNHLPLCGSRHSPPMNSRVPAARFLIHARRGEETKFLLFKPGARPAQEREAASGETGQPSPESGDASR